MLRWRIVLGTSIVLALVGLCWLDHVALMPGVWLLPVAVVLTVLAGQETLDLLRPVGFRPSVWTVHLGNLLIVLGTWVPLAIGRLAQGLPPDESYFVCQDWAIQGWAGRIDWALLALTAAVLALLFGRTLRYTGPGSAVGDLAGGMLALVYVGLMMSFLVRLRLGWGIGALASLVIVVKMGDTGAYTVGRLIGRHKLAPALSPGKTIEGALGGLAFSVAGAWVSFQWLVPWLAAGESASLGSAASAGPPGWGWIVYGLMVSLAGMLGDLVESLLKREAGRKDSSRWMPGFGGILDILDSLLLAAPIAYIFWATGLVGPMKALL